MRIQCAPLPYRVDRVPDLDVEWDPVAGTISGPGAEYIKEYLEYDHVSLHPPCCGHDLSAEPLKSYVDMAAIIGNEYILPDVLAPHYPYPDSDFDENVYAIIDGKEVVVGQIIYG
jgi:hypothetical protein